MVLHPCDSALRVYRKLDQKFKAHLRYLKSLVIIWETTTTTKKNWFKERKREEEEGREGRGVW